MNGSTMTEEHEIIKQCLDGDADQYAFLVDRYSVMAFNIAYRMLGDSDIAKDMAQESFISAYNALDNFSSVPSFPPGSTASW